MEISWILHQPEIDAAREIVASYRDHAMVRDRHTRNLADRKPTVTRARFWKALVSALLTTQQRSGPESAVARFICTRPFPLNYKSALEQSNPKHFFSTTLAGFGGIRRHGRIADELDANLQKLESGLWKIVNARLNLLRTSPTRSNEVLVANFFDDEFAGIGPKQARNLLQGLGLTQYEIPIDSRITKWLNNIGFPVQLSAAALADRNYYSFVMEGIYQLCLAAELSPCVLDAAVFSSFDGDGWTEDNVGW